MKRIKTTLILTGMAFILAVQGYSQSKWQKDMQKIVPLLSNRDDVLKQLGNPIDDPKNDHSWIYDFDEGRMFITFEIGECIWQPGTQTWSGWKVPEGTVTSVDFWLRKPVKPSKLGIDLSKFERVQTGGDADSFEYADEPNGFLYGVKAGRIKAIERIPKAADQSLKCTGKSPEN